MRQHQSILEFQGGRYLRLSLGLCALATVGGPQPLDLIIKGMQRAWLTFKKLPNDEPRLYANPSDRPTDVE